MKSPLPPTVLHESSLSLMMRRRTFLRGVAGLAGAAVLGGCNSARKGEDSAGGLTLRVRGWTDFGYPTPFTYTAGPGYWKQSLIFDTLTWPDSTGKQLPWLAESYQRSEDGLSYTAELRDVQWSDGRPVTAKDVAFTYEYYAGINPATGKENVFTPLLIGVPRKGVEVIPQGDRTIEFRLPRPDATFLQDVLGSMPIVPEHVWVTNKNPMAASDPKFLVSTGPYKLSARNVSQDTETYTANNDYFLGEPFVKRIDMVGIEDPLTALRLGELDGTGTEVEGATNDILKPFRDDPGQYSILPLEGGWGFPLFFNLIRGGALADVRFRRACVHALDRSAIVQRLLTGNGVPGSMGFLSPDNPYYNPDIADYPFNRGEAERLLDEAGYRRVGGGGRRNPDGSALRLTLRIPELVPLDMAEFVTANLKDVGLDITLQRTELVQLFGIKMAGTYDMLMTSFPGPAGTGPKGDPEILRGVYYTQEPGRAAVHYATGYSNPDVDRLLDEQQATHDFEQRKRLVGQIQRIVADDVPVAMLYYPTLFFIYRPTVFDQWYYTPGGFGPGIDTDVYNKQAYITGRKEGTQVRS